MQLTANKGYKGMRYKLQGTHNI